MMILHVNRGGPADLAGLRSGDILETVDGQDAKKPDLFKSFPIGKEVKVQYRRRGVRSETVVKLDQTSEEAQKIVEGEPPAPVLTLYGRLKVSKIGMRERIMRYIPSDIEGLLVLENCPGCTEPGKDDVIVSIDGIPVDSPDTLVNSTKRPGFIRTASHVPNFRESKNHRTFSIILFVKSCSFSYKIEGMEQEKAPTTLSFVYILKAKTLPDAHSQFLKLYPHSITDAELKDQGDLDAFFALTESGRKGILVVNFTDREELLNLLNL
jgi:hypothetical protein